MPGLILTQTAFGKRRVIDSLLPVARTKLGLASALGLRVGVENSAGWILVFGRWWFPLGPAGLGGLETRRRLGFRWRSR